MPGEGVAGRAKPAYAFLVKARILVLALACAVTAFTGMPGGSSVISAARVAQSARPTGSTSIVDVAVLDSRGQPLSTLTSRDFKVLIDGQPRTVVSSRYVFRGPGAEASAATASSGDRRQLVEASRLVLFAVDENSILAKGEKPLVSALWRAHDAFGPSDRVALVTLPVTRRVVLTADRQPMRDSVGSITGRGREPERFTQALDHPRNENDSRGDVPDQVRPDPKTEAGQPPTPLRPDTASTREDGLDAAASDEAVSRNRSTSLQALTRTVAGLRAMPGNKTVVLLWGGATGADPEDASKPADLRADMPALIDEAAAAQATIHVVLVPRTPRARIRNADLEALAKATGGIVLTAPSDGATLGALAAATSGLYRLEVEARSSDTDLKPHDLAVSVSQSGARVLARRRWLPGDTEGFAEAGSPAVRAADDAPAAPTPARRDAPPSRVTIKGTPTSPALLPLVTKISEYVEHYVRELSTVVAEEEYAQRVVSTDSELLKTTRDRNPALIGPDGTVMARRRLKSDLLLLQTGGPDGWVPFRDVVAVDGQPVPDRADRLRRLFLEHPESALDQAGKITEESSRYNLGNVHRTVNQPTLVLAFLMPGYVSGFRFEQKGDEEVEGTPAVRLDYEEVARPTIIRQGKKGSDIPAKGSIWVDPSSGRVLRTRVRAEDGRVSMEATVTFRRNEELGVWTPAEMVESYRKPNEQISGSAVYRNFRRFKVTTEERIKN